MTESSLLGLDGLKEAGGWDWWHHNQGPEVSQEEAQEGKWETHLMAPVLPPPVPVVTQ